MNRRSLFKTFAGLAAVPAAEKLASGETGVGGLDRYRDLVTHGNRFDGWAPINRMQSIALGRNDHEVAVISPAATGKTELAIAWMLEPTISMRAEDRKYFVGLLTASNWASMENLVKRAKRLYAPAGRFYECSSEFVFSSGERILVRARTQDLLQRISGFSFSRQAHDGIVGTEDYAIARSLILATARSANGRCASLLTARAEKEGAEHVGFPYITPRPSQSMIVWKDYGVFGGPPLFDRMLL